MPNDYLYSEDMDLLISDAGDFTVGESTSQHQQVLLIAEKGEIRQYPLTGVGAVEFLNDDNPGALYSEIQRQFEADSMKVLKLLVNQDGKVNVNANYPE